MIIMILAQIISILDGSVTKKSARLSVVTNYYSH